MAVLNDFFFKAGRICLTVVVDGGVLDGVPLEDELALVEAADAALLLGHAQVAVLNGLHLLDLVALLLHLLGVLLAVAAAAAGPAAAVAVAVRLLGRLLGRLREGQPLGALLLLGSPLLLHLEQRRDATRLRSSVGTKPLGVSTRRL